MIEVRWHARAGQGAKTASQLFAMAELATGRFVQAFPEYGPERGGAPMRAYNRADERPIRRRYGIKSPDAVVVLDESLLGEATVLEGMGPEVLLLANSERPAEELGAELGWAGPVLCVPGTRLAEAHGPKSVNAVMIGALAQALGEPPADELIAAAEELFSAKLDADAMAGVLDAVREGRQAATSEAANV